MKKALLVDDDNVTNFLNQNILKNKLKVKDIISTNDGAEALQYLIENYKYKGNCPPDLIILDLVMPIINGVEFLNIINRILDRKKTKVIILSGLPKDYIEEKKELKTYNILEKPLTAEALKKEIPEVERILK